MGYMNEFPHSRMFDSDLREILEMYSTVKGLPSDWNTFKETMTVHTEEAVSKWLDTHPEATTTVQDNSLTVEKLNGELKNQQLQNLTNIITIESLGVGENGDIAKPLNDLFTNIGVNEGRFITIRFSGKKYICSDTVYLTGGVTLEGVGTPRTGGFNGDNTTVIEFTCEDANKPMFATKTLTSTGDLITYDKYKDYTQTDIDVNNVGKSNNITLKNLDLVGDISTSLVGFAGFGAIGLSMDNVRIRDFRYGVYLRASWYLNISNCNFRANNIALCMNGGCYQTVITGTSLAVNNQNDYTTNSERLFDAITNYDDSPTGLVVSTCYSTVFDMLDTVGGNGVFIRDSKGITMNSGNHEAHGIAFTFDETEAVVNAPWFYDIGKAFDFKTICFVTVTGIFKNNFDVLYTSNLTRQSNVNFIGCNNSNQHYYNSNGVKALDTSTIYVDGANGDDVNNGSFSKPVKTLGKALNLVSDNGTVYLLGNCQTGTATVRNKNITITGKTNYTISCAEGIELNNTRLHLLYTSISFIDSVGFKISGNCSVDYEGGAFTVQGTAFTINRNFSKLEFLPYDYNLTALDVSSILVNCNSKKCTILTSITSSFAGSITSNDSSATILSN